MYLAVAPEINRSAVETIFTRTRIRPCSDPERTT
jgi:hypothetical protein